MESEQQKHSKKLQKRCHYSKCWINLEDRVAQYIIGDGGIDMSTLLLRLAAPLQAWGINSKFDIRKTERRTVQKAE